jgi:hypothetical protein
MAARHSRLLVSLSRNYKVSKVCGMVDDMTRATSSDSDMRQHQGQRLAYRALLGATVLVAVVTFALSFHGLNDYGRGVAQLGWMSFLVPIGVDGLTLVAVAATFLLRHHPARVRAYAWSVFLFANVASVAGNLSHANARNLSWDGAVGAGAAPVLLALASHLAIVTRRALERDTQRHDTATARVRHEAPAPATPPAADVPVATAPPVPVSRPAGPRRATSKRSGDSIAERVRQMYRDGRSHPEIALALRISKKTAERHTAPLRQSTPDDSEERAS